MQARRTLAPGQKGTKKFLERYGEQLVCVRYRYDEQRRKRFTTVEIIIEESGWSPLRLSQAHETVIRRHIKIKGAANPYDPEWELYFEERAQRQMVERTGGNGRWLQLWLGQKGQCVVCGQELEYEGDWHIHHLQRRVDGGSNALSNLVLLHANCHRQVHQQGWQLAKPRPVTGASLKA